MKRIVLALSITALCLFIFAKGQSQPGKLSPVTEANISKLLSQMTIEEKVGQMAQVAIDQIGTIDNNTKTFSIDEAKLTDVIVKYKIGSILNTPPSILMTAQQWNAIIKAIQDKAMQLHLKIPVIYGLDDIHGVNYVNGFTSFPQQIGQAATWNRQLVQDLAVVTAYESRAAGVPWTFSPVLDLGSNAVWPRVWEGYGEDPYLIGELGTAFVKGAQNPLGSHEKLSVSLKHFMAYSDPKYGKDRTNAWIPENYLREYHLPPYLATVNAGARNVMVNSALINGIPTHMNKYILTDILKNELHFTGFIVTDWQDVENIAKRDKIAKDNKEAVMLAINAGIDMSMTPYNFQEFCSDVVALVKEGKISLPRIDDAVRRVLRVKYELDLFKTPVTMMSDYPKFGSAEFIKKAYNTAAESITLLKNNDNILPLPASAKILVTGPNANSMRPLNGGWTYTWQGERTDEFTAQYNTILEAVTSKFGKSNVSYAEGVAYNMKGKYWEDSVVDIAAAVTAAQNADYILLCLGENSYTETPGNLNEMNLSENQVALANALAKTGKKIILLLTEGRGRIISHIEPLTSAVVHTFLPGNYGADALADILAGSVNPSGKLPITYPRYSNSLTPYIHKPSDQIANPQGAYDYSADFNPQYPFGFGLSYTTFAYSNLKTDKKSYGPNDAITFSVTVKNTGKREGKEVVELFVSDLLASLTPDVKRLRGFDKISLKTGEEKIVTLKVAAKELSFVNTNNKKRLEQGDFEANVGGQSVLFSVNKTVEF